MCDPISILMQLGGFVLDKMMASDQSDNSLAIINAENQRQAELQRQANQAVLNSLNQFTPQEREQKLQEIAQQQKQQYLNTVGRQAQLSPPASGVTGRVSNDYLGAARDAQASEIERIARLAGLQSQLDAAGQLRQQQAVSLGDLAAQTGMLGNFSRNSATLANQAYAAASREQPNPVLAGASGLLKGLGSGTYSSGHSRPWASRSMSWEQLNSWKPSR